MIKKIISTMTLIAFCAAEVIFNPMQAAYAALPLVGAQTQVPAFRQSLRDGSLSLLKLPEDLGYIEERYQSDREAPTVIFIQDAHAIPQAQSSIYKILRYLLNAYTVDAVALEGTDKAFDPSLFRAFPDREKLEQVFGDYMRSGELSGAIAASVLGDDDTLYVGMEDPSLYEEGTASFLVSLNEGPKLEEYLEQLEGELNTLKEGHYSAQTMALDRRLKRWRVERGYLSDLMAYMVGIHPVDEHAYPLVHSLAKSIKLEEFKSAKEFDQELEAIASAIKPVLTATSQIRDFHQKLQAYRTEAISRAGFASVLSDLLSELQETKHIELPNISQRLEELTRHHNLLSRTRGPEFFTQWDAYVAEVKDTVVQGPEERRIDNLDRQIFLLGKLKRLELSRTEWDALNDWMRHVIAFDGVAEGLAAKVQALFDEETTLAFRHFYETTFKRDQVFLENIKKLSAKQADKTVVVITGGFHREALAESFRAEGISFAVVTPDIDEIPEQTRYQDYMRGQVSWNKYFKVRKGRIDLRAAFTEATVDRLTEGSVKQGLTLRAWRDSVIRSLYEQGRITQAGRYTQLLDRKIESRMEDDLITRFTEKWSANLERFIERINILDQQDRLTEAEVARILSSPTNQFAEAVPAGTILAVFRTQSLRPDFLLRYPGFRARSELRGEDVETVNLSRVIKKPGKWFKPYDLGTLDGNKANRHFLKNAFRVADALGIRNVDIVDGFATLDEEITPSTVSFWRTDPAATITFANAAILALVLLESEFAYEPAAAVSRILGTRVASNKGLSLRQLAPIFTGVKNVIDEVAQELVQPLSGIDFDRNEITPELAERFKQHVYSNIYRMTPALKVTHYEINNALNTTSAYYWQNGLDRPGGTHEDPVIAWGFASELAKYVSAEVDPVVAVAKMAGDDTIDANVLSRIWRDFPRDDQMPTPQTRQPAVVKSPAKSRPAPPAADGPVNINRLIERPADEFFRPGSKRILAEDIGDRKVEVNRHFIANTYALVQALEIDNQEIADLVGVHVATVRRWWANPIATITWADAAKLAQRLLRDESGDFTDAQAVARIFGALRLSLIQLKPIFHEANKVINQIIADTVKPVNFKRDPLTPTAAGKLKSNFLDNAFLAARALNMSNAEIHEAVIHIAMGGPAQSGTVGYWENGKPGEKGAKRTIRGPYAAQLAKYITGKKLAVSATATLTGDENLTHAELSEVFAAFPTRSELRTQAEDGDLVKQPTTLQNYFAKRGEVVDLDNLTIEQAKTARNLFLDNAFWMIGNHYSYEEIRQTTGAGSTGTVDYWKKGKKGTVYRSIDLEYARELAKLALTGYPEATSYYRSLAYLFGDTSLSRAQIAAIFRRARERLPKGDVAQVSGIREPARGLFRKGSNRLVKQDADTIKTNQHFLENAGRVADNLEIDDQEIADVVGVHVATVRRWWNNPIATINWEDAAKLARYLLRIEKNYTDAAAVARMIGAPNLSLIQMAPIFDGARDAIKTIVAEQTLDLPYSLFDASNVENGDARRLKLHALQNVFRVTPQLGITNPEINEALDTTTANYWQKGKPGKDGEWEYPSISWAYIAELAQYVSASKQQIRAVATLAGHSSLGRAEFEQVFSDFGERSELRAGVDLNRTIENPKAWLDQYTVASIDKKRANRHFIRNALAVVKALWGEDEVTQASRDIAAETGIAFGKITRWWTYEGNEHVTISWDDAVKLAKYLLEDEAAYDDRAAVARLVGIRRLSVRQLAAVFTDAQKEVDQAVRDKATPLPAAQFNPGNITVASAERFKQRVLGNIYRVTPVLSITHGEINQALRTTSSYYWANGLDRRDGTHEDPVAAWGFVSELAKYVTGEANGVRAVAKIYGDTSIGTAQLREIYASFGEAPEPAPSALARRDEPTDGDIAAERRLREVITPPGRWLYRRGSHRLVREDVDTIRANRHFLANTQAVAREFGLGVEDIARAVGLPVAKARRWWSSNPIATITWEDAAKLAQFLLGTALPRNEVTDAAAVARILGVPNLSLIQMEPIFHEANQALEAAVEAAIKRANFPHGNITPVVAGKLRSNFLDNAFLVARALNLSNSELHEAVIYAALGGPVQSGTVGYWEKGKPGERGVNRRIGGVAAAELAKYVSGKRRLVSGIAKLAGDDALTREQLSRVFRNLPARSELRTQLLDPSQRWLSNLAEAPWQDERIISRDAIRTLLLYLMSQADTDMDGLLRNRSNFKQPILGDQNLESLIAVYEAEVVNRDYVSAAAGPDRIYETAVQLLLHDTGFRQYEGFGAIERQRRLEKTVDETNRDLFRQLTRTINMDEWLDLFETDRAGFWFLLSAANPQMAEDQLMQLLTEKFRQQLNGRKSRKPTSYSRGRIEHLENDFYLFFQNDSTKNILLAQIRERIANDLMAAAADEANGKGGTPAEQAMEIAIEWAEAGRAQWQTEVDAVRREQTASEDGALQLRLAKAEANVTVYTELRRHYNDLKQAKYQSHVNAVKPGTSIKQELELYQHEGIDFGVRTLRGFIGDEPGLGKSVQALGVAQVAKDIMMQQALKTASENQRNQRVLLIAANGVLNNWEEKHIQSWLPNTERLDLSAVDWNSMTEEDWNRERRIADGLQELPEGERPKKDLYVIIDADYSGAYGNSTRMQRLLYAKNRARFVMINYNFLATGQDIQWDGDTRQQKDVLAEELRNWGGADQGPDLIIVDEAHRFKNATNSETKTLISMRSTRPEQRILLLSGTLLVNSVGDLYPLLHLLDPEEYPEQLNGASNLAASQRGFGRRYQGVAGRVALNLDLRRRGIIIRRSREQVLGDNLPERLDTEFVEVSLEQRLTPAGDNLQQAVYEYLDRDLLNTADNQQRVGKITRLQLGSLDLDALGIDPATLEAVLLRLEEALPSLQDQLEINPRVQESIDRIIAEAIRELTHDRQSWGPPNPYGDPSTNPNFPYAFTSPARLDAVATDLINHRSTHPDSKVFAVSNFHAILRRIHELVAQKRGQAEVLRLQRVLAGRSEVSDVSELGIPVASIQRVIQSISKDLVAEDDLVRRVEHKAQPYLESVIGRRIVATKPVSQEQALRDFRAIVMHADYNTATFPKPMARIRRMVQRRLGQEFIATLQKPDHNEPVTGPLRYATIENFNRHTDHDSPDKEILLAMAGSGGEGFDVVGSEEKPTDAIYIVDSPLTDARREQVISRIYRRGQSADEIHIRQYYAPNTWEATRAIPLVGTKRDMLLQALDGFVDDEQLEVSSYQAIQDASRERDKMLRLLANLERIYSVAMRTGDWNTVRDMWDRFAKEYSEKITRLAAYPLGQMFLRYLVELQTTGQIELSKGDTVSFLPSGPATDLLGWYEVRRIMANLSPTGDFKINDLHYNLVDFSQAMLDLAHKNLDNRGVTNVDYINKNLVLDDLEPEVAQLTIGSELWHYGQPIIPPDLTPEQRRILEDIIRRRLRGEHRARVPEALPRAERSLLNMVLDRIPAGITEADIPKLYVGQRNYMLKQLVQHTKKDGYVLLFLHNGDMTEAARTFLEENYGMTVVHNGFGTLNLEGIPARLRKVLTQSSFVLAKRTNVDVDLSPERLSRLPWDGYEIRSGRRHSLTRSGADVIHIHPPTDDGDQGDPTSSLNAWIEDRVTRINRRAVELRSEEVQLLRLKGELKGLISTAHPDIGAVPQITGKIHQMIDLNPEAAYLESVLGEILNVRFGDNPEWDPFANELDVEVIDLLRRTLSDMNNEGRRVIVEEPAATGGQPRGGRPQVLPQPEPVPDDITDDHDLMQLLKNPANFSDGKGYTFVMIQEGMQHFSSDIIVDEDNKTIWVNAHLVQDSGLAPADITTLLQLRLHAHLDALVSEIKGLSDENRLELAFVGLDRLQQRFAGLKESGRYLEIATTLVNQKVYAHLVKFLWELADPKALPLLEGRILNFQHSAGGTRKENRDFLGKYRASRKAIALGGSLDSSVVRRIREYLSEKLGDEIQDEFAADQTRAIELFIGRHGKKFPNRLSAGHIDTEFDEEMDLEGDAEETSITIIHVDEAGERTWLGRLKPGMTPDSVEEPWDLNWEAIETQEDVTSIRFPEWNGAYRRGADKRYGITRLGGRGKGGQTKIWPKIAADGLPAHGLLLIGGREAKGPALIVRKLPGRSLAAVFQVRREIADIVGPTGVADSGHMTPIFDYIIDDENNHPVAIIDISKPSDGLIIPQVTDGNETIEAHTAFAVVEKAGEPGTMLLQIIRNPLDEEAENTLTIAKPAPKAGDQRSELRAIAEVAAGIVSPSPVVIARTSALTVENVANSDTGVAGFADGLRASYRLLIFDHLFVRTAAAQQFSGSTREAYAYAGTVLKEHRFSPQQFNQIAREEFRASLDRLVDAIQRQEVKQLTPIIFYSPEIKEQLLSFVARVYEAVDSQPNLDVKDFQFHIVFSDKEKKQKGDFLSALSKQKAAAQNLVRDSLYWVDGTDSQWVELTKQLDQRVIGNQKFADAYGIFFPHDRWLALSRSVPRQRIVRSNGVPLAFSMSLVPPLAQFLSTTETAEITAQALDKALERYAGSVQYDVSTGITILTTLLQLMAASHREIAASA
ncbi:MAG: SNF2-related protein [Candidatus Omnitrophota bacterium]|nr:SNF2-related protein [Candidatus Omnitrophota bacterium]